MNTELNKLYQLVREIAKLWDYDKRYLTISVVLQNMATKSKKENLPFKFWDKYLDILKAFAEQRPYCHVSQWVYSEAKMIIDGYYMSQDKW